MKNFLLSVTALLLITGCGPDKEVIPSGLYVSEIPGDKSLALVEDRSPLPILCSEDDHQGVKIAVKNLRADFVRVSGEEPELGLEAEQLKSSSKEVIIVGTIGHSPLVDGMIREGRLDVDEIRGKWESSMTTVVFPTAGGPVKNRFFAFNFVLLLLI